jgi:preprotein translocase SecE subunit
MAMNREQKREMQKRGLAGADGAPVSSRDRRQAPVRTKEKRTPIRQVIQEIGQELRKTSWPTRQETVRLAAIVFVAIVVLTLFVFGCDLFFNWVFDHLFNTSAPSQSAAAHAAFLIRAIQ